MTMCVLYSYFETTQTPNVVCVPCSYTAGLPKTPARSAVFTQREIVLFGWNEKCTVSDSACNSTFICYHVTDNPPIKWQGSARVLYKIYYFYTYTYVYKALYLCTQYFPPSSVNKICRQISRVVGTVF